jgi:hypothetical protein
MKDNAYIRSGYRVNFTCSLCMKSLLHKHNGTKVPSTTHLFRDLVHMDAYPTSTPRFPLTFRFDRFPDILCVNFHRSTVHLRVSYDSGQAHIFGFSYLRSNANVILHRVPYILLLFSFCLQMARHFGLYRNIGHDSRQLLSSSLLCISGIWSLITYLL